MQDDDMTLADVVEAQLGPTQAPAALEFDLARPTFLLLAHAGVFNTSQPEQTGANQPAYSTLAWRPLIPIADAITLLQAVPAALVPAGRVPFAVTPKQPSPQSRQHLLDTIARLGLEQPLTLEVMRRFRPLNAHLWGRWLEMLGLNQAGEWTALAQDRAEVEGEREAVEKVYRAMVEVLPVFENVFPFLMTLLRHPLLAAPPIPSPTESHTTLAAPLLAFYALIHTLPHLATSTQTSTAIALPWSFPTSVEVIMKTHTHRGTRLLAWRILRKWYGFYAGLGEALREAWVWKGEGSEQGSFAPLPPYVAEYKDEYESLFGEWKGESADADLVAGWTAECTGDARFVDGGIEVLVRERAIDAWILPAVVDAKAREERANLWRVDTVPASSFSADDDAAFAAATSLGSITAGELSSTVVNVEGYLLFREGFIPSTSYPSLSPTARTPAAANALPSTTGPKPEPFVPTPATTKLLHSLALHTLRRLPVLISSPPSSGKASTITHLWSLLHAHPRSSAATPSARQRSLVLINLADRSLDSKSLLGSLSSAPATADTEAGTFAFVEGPLTRAVRQGRWVVLSGIDQASIEVLSVIKVLVERMRRASESAVGAAWGGGGNEESGGVGVRVGGGEGRWVSAGRGFMLFATRSVDGGVSGAGPEANFFTSGFWSEVWMDGPKRDEIGLIVQGRYPRLRAAGLAERLIGVWDGVRDVVVKDGGAGTNRSIGVRDLMRWCRRVEGLIPRDVAITSIESNPILQEEVFTEARDVFLGSLPVPPIAATSPDAPVRDRYALVARVLAQGLGLSQERAEWVIRRRVPELVVPRREEDDGIVSTAELALKIGRVSLPYRPTARPAASSRPYALTKPSLVVLEKLAVSVRLSEPVLMVGETGTGKTAAVGHLADLLGKNLTALNLSNQTEAGDLVGGFRPIDEAEEARRTASELVNRFVDLFGQTFSISRNAEYVSHVRKAFEKKRWPRIVSLWREAYRMASERLGMADAPAARKRRKVDSVSEDDLPTLWREFVTAVGDFDIRHVSKAGKSKFVFSFVEGPLAKAIRSGDWVLLDEVNLASSETLESLSTLLQGPDSSLVLTEQGDLEPIPRHPDFRLFACMNPATDVGKRDLPAGLRAKFSEIWVPPPDEDRDALVTIVQGYIGRVAVQDRAVILDVAELYSAVKALAIGAQLADGANAPPHFSMRTLARALTFAAEFAPVFGLRRALYEGFLMAFTMLLDAKSNALVKQLLEQHIVAKAKNRGSMFAQIPTKPSGVESIRFGPYWLETGEEPLQEAKDYILTPSVQSKVLDLARAVLTRKVPVLIQGPTSAGKTSVVEYLARRTGHRFVRINNHEHTDIQEYIGTYVSDTKSGKLVFQEGVLVRALRRGDWIVLDELNLAPTDVLEALNRLLDDNRELVIPETGEVVRPHPHFMLFATQNPPGLYGGRKVLSRAFRNRFLEMHFGDVPKDELETILCQRCQIAPSYAKKTVGVFIELQRRRQAGRVFEQKHAFVTLRDLFRWGGRGSVGYQQLAEDGYMLLAERARKADDKAVVKDVIELEMNVKIDETTLYDFTRLGDAGLPAPTPNDGLVWTSAMRRLYYLIAASLHRNEPVLLVGETGSGKTSVCQSLALALGSQLHVVGCHQNTETADLLGGQRPLRSRAALQAALRDEASAYLAAQAIALPYSNEEDIEDVIAALEVLEKSAAADSKVALRELADRMRRTTALFEWHDGPLVQAMHGGDLILLDEISLADDSVLERLNSVLEPSRTLVLAEKGGRDLDDIQVVGADGFQILATMNPGGDFGKKELSPALRNRFTEIWVPHVDNAEDLIQIINSRWADAALAPFGPQILEFGSWFASTVGITDGLGVGLRDILAWVDFLNVASRRLSSTSSTTTSPTLTLADAFYQGALMTVVDGLGALPTTSGLSKDGLERLRASCALKLASLVPEARGIDSTALDVVDSTALFFVGAFGVGKGALPPAAVDYTLQAPTTRLNAMRLLRALQLTKPVLLEGSPGVGKTSLVTALAAATGHHLVRINLSDQTDLMDLLGSDLPVEGGRSGEFAWKDAPFLAAMQEGSWVLLDEMNLASQSILEGLNSSLDHRGTVYIPELDRTFSRHPDFRIFAAQNPLGQGGGRKGLPRSFLDRFSIVHMEELNSVDLNAIATSLYPDIAPAVVEKMILFNSDIHRQTMDARKFGMEGSPWEFNLRDVLRWLALVRSSTGLDLARGDAVEYVGLLYLQRFRTLQDRTHVARLFAASFSHAITPATRPWPSVSPHFALVGHSLAPRADTALGGRHTTAAPLLQHSLQPLEALAKCVEMGWLAILTGARASGKTTLVRQLAALEGRPLKEFSMNAEVDTLELLGSFEQAERYREIDRIAVDAILLLEDCLRAQLLEPDSSPTHAALSTLHQLRVTVGVATSDFDLADATAVVHSALSHIPDGASGDRAIELQRRLDLAATASSNSARFEWVDGPLIQAMKAGHWLLIEDANLCSPSVLDRLNSLFEPGGRLQLGERGPVDGEIQIIYPHADFRLVMTLDPRNGELSRAMRNRGIEIALLPAIAPTPEDRERLAASSRTSVLPELSHSAALLASTAILTSDSALPLARDLKTNAFAVDQFAEAALAPTLETLALCTADLDSTALAKVLFESLAQAHHGLALRFLRTMALLDSIPLDSGLRTLGRHPVAQRVVVTQQEQAATLQVPFELLQVQPLDPALAPQLGPASAEVALLSPSVGVLVSLLLSFTSRPERLRLVTSKPARSLDVWDKSILAAAGKVRLDDADPALLALAPLSGSLADLVSNVLAVHPSQLSPEDQRALVSGAASLQSLLLELEHISHAEEVDFSSIQHVAAWIAKALLELPAAATALTPDAERQLAPLQSSLTLTTGKAMTSIWRACLPFRSPSEVLDAAYQRLLSRGANSIGELWDPAVVGLFLDIAVTLGIPQPRGNSALESAAVDIVDRILVQIPASASLSNPDETFVLTVASNAATLVVTELAAVADAFGPSEYQKSITAVLVEVSRRSAAVPLSSSIPLHQLVSWPEDSPEDSRSSVEFATLLGLSERLALGLISTSSAPFATAELVKPVLLRASNLLRITDSSSLGNLVPLSESLQRAAAIQALAATEYQSRIAALRCILVSAIALATTISDDAHDDPHAPGWTPAALLAPTLPLSPAFGEAVDRHLASAIPHLTPADASLSAVGEGFVAFARCFWHLYVPSLPLDPAIGLRARTNYLGRQLLVLTDLFAAHERAEAGRTGNGESVKLARVGAEVAALRQELDSVGDVPITREGNPALLSSLFRELRSFQEQIVNDTQLDSLLEVIRGDWTPELASREANLQHSVATLLRRLDIAYASLNDILAPVRLALCALKIGFALLLHTCRVESAGPESAPFALLLHHLTSFPTIAHTVDVESTELPLSIKPGEAPLPPSRATLLQISSLTLRLSTQALFDRSTLHRLTALYDRMHYLWSVDRRHEEEEAQAAASLYRTKTDVQDIKSDEEIEAAEFAQLFPTFDDVSDPDKPLPAAATAPLAAAVAPTHPRLLRPTDQATLASLHLDVFGPNAVVGSPKDFETLRATSVATLLPTMFDTLDEALDRDSAVFRIRTLVELSQALAPSATVQTRERDFYTDPDVKETAKAVPILLALARRLAQLIELWPDQMVLRNLLERCEKITSFSSKTSIAQVLTAIEQLLSHTEDWESYASREHSLIVDRTAVTNLIVEWRRLELTCWSRLLSTVQAHFGDPVAEWWFRFYETTIRGAPGVDVDASEEATQTPAEYYRDLVTLLNSFLSSSSLGQYQARLNLVLSFANLAHKLATDSGSMDGSESLAKVSRVMLNVHAFYDQFMPRVSTFLTTERNRIEKDVQALIKLASWKDVNVYALRQSAIKSHHQLYKSVRKLRAVLQKPASDFFTIPEADRTLQPTSQLPASSDVAVLVPSLPADLDDALDAPHIARLEQTLGRLASMLSTRIEPFLGVDRATAVDEFAVQIITTAKSLKDESAPGEEEGREQRIKSLTQRKRRAWIELLRELKRIGLSPTPTPEVVARLQDPNFVYGIQSSRHLLEIDASGLSDQIRTLLGKAHDYHFRLLSELPALRAIPAAHHDDISTREVQRAIGSIESCINLGFDNREHLVGAIARFARLSAIVGRMQLVGDAEDAQPSATSGSLVKSLLALVSGVRHALEETRRELTNHRLALGTAAASTAVSTVEAAVAEASRLLEADQDALLNIGRGMGAVDFSLSVPSERAAFETARKHLVAVEQALATTPCPPSLRYIVHPLASWVSSLEIPVLESATERAAAPAAELAALSASHKTLVDSVLVLAQELQKMSAVEEKPAPTPVDEDELPDHAVKQANRSLQATLAVLRLPEILAQVEAFTVAAHGLSTSPVSGATVAVLLRRVAPFVQHYAHLVERHLAAFLEWHKASLKLAHVLTALVKDLSATGFCKPSDDDGSGGDAGADGKTTDGTGMADGQGATNVSKDIEDESQIEGLESDVDKKEEKPEEKEGDDDAVEMSNDFDGEMEDRGDGDKDENDDDGDESDTESQPDPEEQIADVDPLDPSSVDEKFWGDEASKDSSKNEEINQETTKQAGESEMAAKEDEAPAPQPKTDDASEAPKDEPPKDQPPPPDAGETGGDAEDENADVEGEDEGEDDGDNVPQADDGERLDDRMPEADNLDLPDDMQLDGDDNQKEDDLDLGSDMGDLPDMDEGENDNDPDEVDENGDPTDQDADDDALPAADAPPEGDQPELTPEEAPALDQSLGGADEGETGGEGAQDSSSASKPDPLVESDPSADKSGTKPEPKPTPAAAEEGQAEEGPQDDGDAHMDADADPSPTAPSNSADGQTKQRSAASDPKSDPSRARPNDPSPAEPQRSLGDALQSWRRRLEAIADLADTEADAPEEQLLDPDAPGQDDEVEYVPDGDEREQDGQALGPAKEEQVQGLEHLRLGEDDTETAFEPDDAMDVDDAAPTLPQQPTAIQLEGSSLAEADAKAIHADELRDDRVPVALDDAADDAAMRDDDAELPSTSLAQAVDPEDNEAVEQAMLQWRSGDDDDMTAEGVWRLYESLTRDLSYALTEQLRLILEPTLATRLKGDYRSGKRLNMKKIIPYIASEFTKDKIWLRRTRPSQREYQILIAIDDSKSMADSHSVHLAYQTLALISRALARLEVGGISICKFGDTMDVLHSFESGAVSDEAGAALLGKFTFAQRTTDVRLLVERSLAHLALAKERARATKSSLAAGDLWQLQIIISDGMCQDHEKLRALLRQGAEQKVLFVFVVIDSLHRRSTDGPDGAEPATPASASEVNQNSILAMKSVSYSKGPDGRLELQMTRYLDSFPFDNFIVIRDVEALPEVLSQTLRQFMERVSTDK